MSSSILWCSVVLCAFQICVANTSFKFSRKRSTPPEVPPTKPFLNIANPNLFVAAFTEQLLSMITDKDFLPWDADPNVNRRNHEIMIAFTKLKNRLHAIGATYGLSTAAANETVRQVTKDMKLMPMAISMVCDYIEDAMKSGYPRLYAEYENLKKRVNAELGKGNFTRNVYFQECPQDLDTQKDKYLKERVSILNDPNSKLNFIALAFQEMALSRYFIYDHIMAKSFVRTAENIKIQNKLEGEDLQGIYDNAVVHIANDLEMRSYSAISFKDTAYDWTHTPYVVGAALVDKMQNQIEYLLMPRIALLYSELEIMTEELTNSCPVVDFKH